MPWGIAAAAVGSGISALASGGGSGGASSPSGGQSTGGSTTPYQQQAYGNLVNQAGTVLQQRQAQGPYGGQYVAAQNPWQQGAIDAGATTGWADNANGNTATAVGNQQQQIGGTLENYGNLYGNTAANLIAGGVTSPNSTILGGLNNYATGSGGGLSGALNGAAISGAQSLQTAQGTLGQVGQQALSDPTQRLAGDANSYMNSAPVQQAINSTNANIASTLNEQTAPGLDRQAAAGGTLNSSRAGAAQAGAQGQAALATGAADSSIENNAFNQGLGVANSAYATGLGAATNSAAASGGLGNATALGAGGQQIGAANSALNDNLAYNQATFNNQIAANAQVGNTVAMGQSLSNSGVGNQTAASNQFNNEVNLFGNSGALQQQGLQANDTNALDSYLGSNNYSQNLLQGYQGLITGNYGASQTGTSNTSSNLYGNILGGAGVGAGLYNQYGGSVGSSISGGQLGGLFGGSDSSGVPIGGAGDAWF